MALLFLRDSKLNYSPSIKFAFKLKKPSLYGRRLGPHPPLNKSLNYKLLAKLSFLIIY